MNDLDSYIDDLVNALDASRMGDAWHAAEALRMAGIRSREDHVDMTTFRYLVDSLEGVLRRFSYDAPRPRAIVATRTTSDARRH